MATPVNAIYVLGGVVPSAISAAPVGVKVVEIYDGNGQLFTAQQVAQMESGNSLLMGYLSVGEAESYRSYFSTLSPSLIGPEDPAFPGDFEVAYWTDTWKTVCTNYIDQMFAQGYKGAYFDVIDECETPWALANAPGGDSRGAMISLVQELANYAHAKDPNFKIWVNTSGAEDLLANSTFVNSIDGAYEEELFYQDSGQPQPSSETAFNLGLLGNLLRAGKPVVTIEYVTGATTVADVETKAAAAGIGYYVANPNLELSGVDTEGFTSPICFLRGTQIATPSGEVAVERLAEGDTVLTLEGKSERIIWIGFGRALVATERRGASMPVIVYKDALADNVPCRDLYLTRGHSLFLDGVLIPVEFLVNYRSIVWDDRPREIEIYHVELAQHCVLLADGAPAESYRDDGNRSHFLSGDDAPERPLGVPQACAPVLTGGRVVDEHWHRLLDRAGRRPETSMTSDPDLHLLVDGQRINRHARHGDRHMFRLPAWPSSVRVVSSSFVPAELGTARDPRRLGVAVRQIAIWQGRRLKLVEADDPVLSNGFHPYEPENGYRWTDGDATLSASWFAGSPGTIELELHIGCAALYPTGSPATEGVYGSMHPA